MTFKPLWHHAAALAARTHANQYRHDGCTPYAAHTSRVAMTIAVIFGFTDEDILAAAYLHDVIEDSDVDYDDLLEDFNANVADFVVAMSKDMRLPQDEKERVYDEQLATGPWQGRLIKLADVYDNLSDAQPVSGKRKIIQRAHRALKLAQADEQLSDACEKVRQLIRIVENDLDQAPDG